MDYLNDYYLGYDEDARLRSRHGMVEYLTTMRYIDRYLFPGARILELGAGTGRYSHALAQRGYAVDAVELIAHNIEVFRQNTQPGEPVTVTQGDARDLSAFADGSYDLTLLLGPMYHLYTEADQRRALSEAVRVTKPGGVLFVSYCGNEATMISFCFQKGRFLEYRDAGKIDDAYHCLSTPADLFQLYRKEDIDALIAPLPLRRLHYLGTDMATNYMRETVDAMDDRMFAAYLDYHFSVCERADLVGASHHVLDVLRKE